MLINEIISPVRTDLGYDDGEKDVVYIPRLGYLVSSSNVRQEVTSDGMCYVAKICCKSFDILESPNGERLMVLYCKSDEIILYNFSKCVTCTHHISEFKSNGPYNYLCNIADDIKLMSYSIDLGGD